MMIPEQVSEIHQYRIVLIIPASKMLLARHHGEGFRLPRIDIPAWTRVGEQLTKVIRKNWDTNAIVIDFLPGTSEASRCAVIEVRNSTVKFTPAGFLTVPVDDLDEAELTSHERATVRSILAGRALERGPFSRLGWVDEAKNWIRESVSDHVVEFSEEMLQLNAGDDFALIRFGTKQGPAYWLKATGKPNRHELSVTNQLVRYSAGSLPPLVATRQDWNAWAMEEVGGSLAQAISVTTINLAGSSLAELQKRTIGRTEELRRSGCGDQCLDLLRGNLGAVFQLLDRVSSWADAEYLPESDTLSLPKLEEILRSALDQMDALQIPDTVTNNDMKLANILSDGQRCVFTDWCHAYIGNPFLAFQHVHTYLQRHHLELASHFRHSYCLAWRTRLSNAQIEGGLELSSLLAPFPYLYGRGIESLVSRAQEPDFQRFCGRLIRHISTVAKKSRAAEAICQ